MEEREWLSSLKIYEGADNRKSLIQLITTLVAYFSLITAMFFLVTMDYPYWIVLLLSIPAAGFHVKIFIIMHDCCHHSFFTRTWMCFLAGQICGIITYTPFFDWQRTHGIHHASVANLDKRGIGDVWVMTVEEYRAAPAPVKILYRAFRHPLFLFGIAPVLLFIVVYRFPHKNMRRRDLASILFTDIAIALVIILVYFTVGIMAFIRVFLPVFVLAYSSGMWLFYIQHQFKNVYWSHAETWDRVQAAMKGSSFYNLPALLRWFSGSIGYHHIHHLKPAIPNYRLKKCYKAIPELQDITPITILTSFRSLFLSLWNEKTGELVSFKDSKNIT